MSRLSLDLCLIILVILNFAVTIGSWNETDAQVFKSIIVVNAIVLLLYAGSVVIPHYTSKMYNVDLARLIRSLGLWIPLLGMTIIAMTVANMDVDDLKLMAIVYIAIALIVFSIAKYIYRRHYMKKDGKITIWEGKNEEER